MPNYALIDTGDINMPIAWKNTMTTNDARRRRLTGTSSSSRPPMKRKVTIDPAVSNPYANKRKKYTPKRFSSTAIGDPVGVSTCKRYTSRDTGNEIVNSRFLYSVPLCTPPKGSDIDDRIRNIINVRGFALNFHIRNNTLAPLCCNFAVIHSRDEGAITVPNNDFFRNSTSSRAISFGTGLSSLDLSTRHINSDKYTILNHTRFILKPLDGNAQYFNQTGNTYGTVSKYIPLKRQLRWEANLNTAPEHGQIFVVYWVDNMFTNSGSAEIPNAATVQERYVMYYRDSY